MNAHRAYVRDMVVYGLLYAALVVGTNLLLEGREIAAWILVPAALLPVLPAAGMLWAILRLVRRLDELQQRIHLEALAFTAGVTALGTLTVGFLEGVGMPRLSWVYVWPLMAAAWGLGLALAGRRYR